MSEYQHKPSYADHAAAAVHRRKAEEHYQAAERFRKLGMPVSQADARRQAEFEDKMADILSGMRR